MNITKIIGALMVLIGAFAVKQQPWSGAISIAVGIVLFLISKKSADQYWNILVNSFEKKILLIALFDTLYFAIAASASWLFGFVLKDVVLQKLGQATFDSGAIIAAPELAQANIEITKGVFASLGVTLALYGLLVLALYAVSRTLIWTTLTNKKPSFDLVKKFFIFSIAWFAIFIIPAWLFFAGLKETYFVYGSVILFAIYGHLTAIAQYSFINTLKIKQSIITAFNTGLLDFKKFIVPYAYLMIIMLIVTKALTILPQQAAAAGTAIGLILYLGWYRCYMVRVFRKFTQLKFHDFRDKSRKLFKEKRQK